MHIIFGEEQALELSKKYTVLPLDTFQFGQDGPVVKAYCAVETIPLEELALLADNRVRHEHLMINYGLRNWPDCLKAIDMLMGLWRGDLDTFYADLRARIQGYVINPPPADWTPIIQK